MLRLILLVICSLQLIASAQRKISSPLSVKAMHEDLTAFRQIREQANSGLYKYRTKQEIDSSYTWAKQQIKTPMSSLEFYRLICILSDFEGSLHNETFLPKKVKRKIRAEESGYFPYPLKLVEGQLRFNYTGAPIPLGAKIVAIDHKKSEAMLKEFSPFYATDGFNQSGKQIGINENFSYYFRLRFGLRDSFLVQFSTHDNQMIQTTTIHSVGYSEYYDNFENRHSKKYDAPSYFGLNELKRKENLYNFQLLDSSTALFTINSFLIGWHAQDSMHIEYTHFLEKTFTTLQQKSIQHLIIDTRHNGGGSDPNDMVTFAYLTDSNFVENTSAWISFNKIPLWRYVNEVPFYMRPIEKLLSNKGIKDAFPIYKNGEYHQSPTNKDQTPRQANKNAFLKSVYLLVGPRTASAGSLFAAMLAGRKNVTVIGEETQGGYYGHNGHIPIRYKLPNSKIKTMFSIVNLEQDVKPSVKQPFGRGIIPDYQVSQSYDDFIQHTDRTLLFTLDLIEQKQ